MPSIQNIVISNITPTSCRASYKVVFDPATDKSTYYEVYAALAETQGGSSPAFGVNSGKSHTATPAFVSVNSASNFGVGRTGSPVPLELDVVSEFFGVPNAPNYCFHLKVVNSGNVIVLNTYSELFQLTAASSNTGFKAWTTLEEYDTISGLATGKEKPNTPGAPDYFPPVYDPSTCPL